MDSSLLPPAQPVQPLLPFILGQPIFPTDKRNPMFTLYRSGVDKDAVIHEYVGAAASEDFASLDLSFVSTRANELTVPAALSQADALT